MNFEELFDDATIEDVLEGEIAILNENINAMLDEIDELEDIEETTEEEEEWIERRISKLRNSIKELRKQIHQTYVLINTF